MPLQGRSNPGTARYVNWERAYNRSHIEGPIMLAGQRGAPAMDEVIREQGPLRS